MSILASFKQRYCFEERLSEATRVMRKHPNKIPIICEKSHYAGNCPTIDKIKYLVDINLTVGQFIFFIRKRLSLRSHQAIFLFVNGNIPSSNQLLQTVYEVHKDADKFLYCTYSFENVFG